MYHYDLRAALQSEAGLGELTDAQEHIDAVLLIVQKMLFRVDTSRFAGFRLENLVSDESGFTFKWVSNAEESNCPRCGTVSAEKRRTYKTRILIDEPILGMPVMHCLRLSVFNCTHCAEMGGKHSFVETIGAICRAPYIKTTVNLDEKIVNDAIYQSANSLSNNYKGSINVSGGTILNRLKEAGGMVTEKNLTETSGVKVLSVDDNNARKGAPSSACTVAVDTERHIILAVARGADSGTAKKIFDRFPDAEMLSRDRDSAYAKAGNDCNLEQIADIFHLVVNAHTAVKEALSKGLDYNIYVKGGDGWVELPAEGNLPGAADTGAPVAVATLSDGDISLRAQLASLTAKQEAKYRTVVALLRLKDQGLGNKEIDNRLGITQSERIRLLCDAADVICGVEDKIDKYYASLGQGKYRQKTVGNNARPSSESIVEPYSETVMEMVESGHNHRSIHPVIKEMGYAGSANAIYQYILKKRRETGLDTPEAPDADAALPLPDGLPQRPPRISLQRATRTSVYKFVLHEASVRRGKDSDKPCDAADEAEPAAEATPNKASRFYSESVADIIMGKDESVQSKKKRKT